MASSPASSVLRRQSNAPSLPPGPPPSQPPPPPPAARPVHPYSSLAYSSTVDTLPLQAASQIPSYSHRYTRESRPGVTVRLAAVSTHPRGSASSPTPASAIPTPTGRSSNALLPPLTTSQIGSSTTNGHSGSHSGSSRRTGGSSAMSPSTTRPSSRRALTAALELAQEAVRLDTNEDPHNAVIAYGQSVALLSEVMERVMGGEEPDAGGRRKSGGRKRSVVAKEEEVRRLKTIHDTYADRMEVLCNIYNIPMHPHLQGHVRSHSQSDTSETPETGSLMEESFQMIEHTGSLEDDSDTIRSMHHPDLNSHPSRASVIPPIRPPPSFPPPVPPTSSSPVTSKPPAPVVIEPSIRSPVYMPHTHRRALSGGEPLAILPENDDEHSDSSTYFDTGRNAHLHPIDSKRDSQPLPPLPNSSINIRFSRSESSTPLPSSSPVTPRFTNGNSRRISTATITAAVSDTVVAKSRDRTSSLSSYSAPLAPAQADPDRNDTTQFLVSSSTAQGSIAQRRKSNNMLSLEQIVLPLSDDTYPQGAQPQDPQQSVSTPAYAPSRLMASALPPGTATSLGMVGNRHRALSQPGSRRPSLPGSNPIDFGAIGVGTPVMAAPAPVGRQVGSNGTTSRKSSLPSAKHSSTSSYSTPPISLQTQISQPLPLSQHHPIQPTSPLPSPQPQDPLRRPYHVMTLLLNSINNKHGGYLTRRLHIPHEVWSQGGAKLMNLQEKGKCVAVLSSALEEVTAGSGEFFRGAGRVSAEKWARVLEDWNAVCEGVVGNMGKKLGVGVKKIGGVTSWSGKVTRTLDRMTNGKNFDSPTTYVLGLAKLFQQAQLFDEHIKALSSSQHPTPYSTLPPELRLQLEARFRRTSEFFASVVLTFVMRDLGLLLDKYARKGEKWLVE